MDSQQIEFRPLTAADLPLLHSWLNRPHVVEWWNAEPSLHEVRAKYLPRIAAGPVRPYVAYAGSEPIGYIQSYVAIESAGGWWTGSSDPSVLGIDQFVAEPGRLGQGLGTAMVSQFASFLFSDPAISRIQVDPHPDNLRAIRCYEKAGFHAQRVVSTPHGSALLMTLDRLD
jgi:aminoglycoside 6'-N-acetyltransferase-1b/aminoglycoside 6'-N-acetyltransferase-2